MTTIDEFNRCGEELERILLLPTSPVAVKMLTTEDEIPEEAIRPKKDRGYHLAQCQAFAISRRERDAVAMLKEDNWCPAPLLAYGMAPFPADPGALKQNTYDRFEEGKYIGVLTAPLRKATFAPQAIIVYCDTNQLRRLLLALKVEERNLVKGHYFPPSCAYAVVTPVLTGEYQVVLPDPGEFTRALTTAGEMMFCLPAAKLENLVASLREYRESGTGLAHDLVMIMRPDFPQPDFYKRIFKGWGMEHG